MSERDCNLWMSQSEVFEKFQGHGTYFSTKCSRTIGLQWILKKTL